MKKNTKKKRKLTIITSILLIVTLLCIVLYYNHYKDKNTLKVNLIENLNIEINSQITLLSLIKNIENGDIISKDTKIDTSTLGEQALELLIQDNFNKENKYNFKINIIDTLAPTIECAKEVTTFKGKNINLLDNVVAKDNSLEEIKIEIEGEYNTDYIGEYSLNYIAKDSSGNQTKENFTLKVINDPNNYTFTTNKGYTGKTINGITYIDGILIANKTYSLPSNYGSGITTETQHAFDQMKADAAILGLNLYLSSGYRSYYDQKYIYQNYVNTDGQANADTYSARAGHSEHQTGLAFDLNTIDDSFTNTPEGIWVHDNCYKYGLILRYPKGKENITGYIHESWHLRYVGIDLATKLYNNGNWITLEEYFGITSKYN